MEKTLNHLRSALAWKFGSLALALVMCLPGKSQTTFTAPVLQDTYISSSTGTTYPTATDISMSAVASNSLSGLIQFDFSSIPYGSTIVSANLIFKVLSAPLSSPNNNFSVQFVPTTWLESSVTWTGQPWGSDGTITDMPAPITATAAVGTITIPITSHAVYARDRQLTYGWILKKINATGSISMASNNYATTTDRPKLVIQYYSPVNITVATLPAATSISTDGSANITVSGGSGNFAYQWYDASSAPLVTTQDISGVASGLYKLEVKDNITLKYYRRYVIIGNLQGSLTINLQPDEVFSQDNNVRSAIALSLPGNPPAPEPYRNYPTDNFLRSGLNGLGNPYVAFLQFNYLGLEDYNDAVIENATLNLYGNGHSNTGGGTNFKIQRVSQLWFEDAVTNINQPTSTTTQEKDINPGPTGSADVTSNVTDFEMYTSLNPTQNMGYALKWYITGSGPFGQNNYVNFHSSSSATTSKRPLLAITFRIKKEYAELNKKHNGGIYNVKNFLNFRYVEEYNDANNLLAYNIYRIGNNQLVATQANQSLAVKYGDNRCTLNVKTIIAGGLGVGTYLLEVVNEKNEKSYLKFNVN